MAGTTVNRFMFWLTPWALGAAILGCGRTDVVSLDGSSTVWLISAAVVETLHRADRTVNATVGASGTGGGFKKFAAGEIDICNASRPITPAEAEACKAAGIAFVEFQVAYDGLAVVVHPQNDWCDSLTVEQLKTIWRAESDGAVVAWSDVNPDWPEIEFKLYGPGDDSGSFDYFTEVINGKAKSSRRDYSPSESDNALVMGVAGDRGSLGYFGYAYYEMNKEKLKLVAIDGGDGPVRPGPQSIRDGRYRPLSRPLFMYVRKSSLARPSVNRLVDFYIHNAKKIAPRVGYFPLRDSEAERNLRRFDETMRSLSDPLRTAPRPEGEEPNG